MQDFSQEIVAWQPFFITLASVCATLAGLLFVAVSLHPERAREQGKVHLKNLGNHTFADFLQVLFIGLFYSVPLAKAAFYGIATLCIVGVGVRQLIPRLMHAWHGAKDEPHRAYFISRVGLSLLGRLLLLAGGASFLLDPQQHADIWNDLMFVFSGCLVLMISGLRNAWFLLLEELG